MTSTRFPFLPLHSVQLARTALALVVALCLAACGGGGEVVVAAPKSAVSTTSLRALPTEYLARKAVSYSPFRTGNRAAEIDALLNPASSAAMNANIKQDLDLLVAGNFKLIRLFDSGDGPIDPGTLLPVEGISHRVLRIIKDNNLDIKVHLGAYVNSFKYVLNPVVVADIRAKNRKELDNTIKLAADFGPANGDIVLAVSVGNETMVSWSTVSIDPADMAGYISYVRSQVTQPVTTDDNFLFYATPPKIITDVIDFASIHTYVEIDTQYPDSPLYWDWRQKGVALGAGNDRGARAAAMMHAADVATRSQYQQVRDALDRKGLGAVPIVIGETGWNAVDLGKLRFRAHPVNQKLYFDRLVIWRAEGRIGAGPANVFYFEAFDEPWKGGDDKWGLFNVDRQARYVIQNLYPSGQWEAGSYTDADALAFVAPAPNAVFAPNQYWVYSSNSDAVGATELSQGLKIDAFDGSTAGAPEVITAGAPDGTRTIEITPTPASYGWGVLFQPTTAYASKNLSQFAAAGTLTFSIKTAYDSAANGKIEIGLSTDTAEGDVQEAFVQIANGQYGYCNTDTWCTVSIPLTAFLAVNPKLDFSMVLTRFMIADRYAFTGKPDGSNIGTKINIDAIRWAK
jgi:exo-beta-1,3-glucanase (GH17 family)